MYTGGCLFFISYLVEPPAPAPFSYSTSKLQDQTPSTRLLVVLITQVWNENRIHRYVHSAGTPVTPIFAKFPFGPPLGPPP